MASAQAWPRPGESHPHRQSPAAFDKSLIYLFLSIQGLLFYSAATFLIVG